MSNSTDKSDSNKRSNGETPTQKLFVEWDEKFSVGLKSIDKQHQGLFSIINKLAAMMSKLDVSDEAKQEVMFQTVISLRIYTITHFKDEEEIMKKQLYNDLFRHQQLHKRYISDISQFYDDLRNGIDIFPSVVLASLTDWLANHILIEDKKALMN